MAAQGDLKSLTRESRPSLVPLTLSYYHGTCHEPLSGATIGQVLVEASRGRPDHVVFRTSIPEGAITMQELKTRADEVSSSLLQLGRRKGDVVFLTGVGDINYFVLFFAITQIGLVFYYPYKCEPTDRQTDTALQVHPSVIIVGNDNDSPSNMAIQKYIEDRRAKAAAVPALISLAEDLPFIDDSTLSYNDFLQLGNKDNYDHVTKATETVSIDDAAVIVWSSGSTTVPKNIIHTHHILVNLGLFAHQRTSPFATDEVISQMNPVIDDLAWIQNMRAICNWKMGVSSVLSPTDCYIKPEDAKKWLSFFQKEKITWHAGLPFELIFAVKYPDLTNYNISRLRGGNLLGQAVGIEQKKELMRHFQDMVTIYGSTEALCCLATSAVFSSDEKRLNSVGYPFPHCEVKLVDRNGATVPIGRTGEICVRGWTVFKEYLNNADLTKVAKDPKKCGWHSMGDIGVMDSTGHVSYIGRTAECVRFKHGGDQVFPGLILQAVCQHSKVKEAKVVGIPNDILGDDICLCVETYSNGEITEEELKEFCEEKLVERDRPDYFFIFEMLPRTGSRNKTPPREDDLFVVGGLSNLLITAAMSAGVLLLISLKQLQEAVEEKVKGLRKKRSSMREQ